MFFLLEILALLFVGLVLQSTSSLNYKNIYACHDVYGMGLTTPTILKKYKSRCVYKIQWWYDSWIWPYSKIYSDEIYRDILRNFVHRAMVRITALTFALQKCSGFRKRGYGMFIRFPMCSSFTKTYVNFLTTWKWRSYVSFYNCCTHDSNLWDAN